MVGRLVALFRRMGLPERLLAVFILVILIEFAANSFLFERVNSFQLRRDDAERIAENLVLAHRTMEHAEPDERAAVAQALSSGRFSLGWLGQATRHRRNLGLSNLRSQVVEIEPELALADLELHLDELPGRGNIGGSFRLEDRSIVRFHTHANAAWTLTIGRVASLVLPTLLLIVMAWLLVRATLRPLRNLIGATRDLGTGPPKPVAEHGPDELRALIRALNDMQARIHQSTVDRTQTMLAIGHDLKTPLSRMRLRLDDDRIDIETREGLNHDIDEMRMLLDSIQAYIESDGKSIAPELIDIAVMVETLVDTAADHGADATYEGASSVTIKVRPVPVRRALSNLLENAIHYGGRARATVRRDGDAVEILIDDDGPGIPEDRVADALQPFIRLDTSRARDTAGMGLGLPIVKKAIEMEKGSLSLVNRPEGGLRATVRLPFSPV